MRRIINIEAILLGFLFIMGMSLLTEQVFLRIHLIRYPLVNNPTPILITLICHRSLYSVMTGFLIAMVVPVNPMRHVLSIGILGICMTTLEAYLVHDLELLWYAVTWIILAVPTCWAGAALKLAWEDN